MAYGEQVGDTFPTVDADGGNVNLWTARSRDGTVSGMTNRDLLLLARARRLASSGEARRLRLDAALSLRDVAGAIGMPHTTLWRWENGQRTPHGPAAATWALLLDQLAKQPA